MQSDEEEIRQMVSTWMLQARYRYLGLREGQCRLRFIFKGKWIGCK